LPDDITRKDGHRNVSVTSGPATSGDSADGYSRQQQQRADPQGAHENANKKNVDVIRVNDNANRFPRIGNPKCQAAKRQYPGDHSQAPSGHAQSVEAGERQPDDDQ